MFCSSVQGTGRRSVKLYLYCKNKIKNCFLENVLVVPSLQYSLLSVVMLIDKEIEVSLRQKL